MLKTKISYFKHSGVVFILLINVKMRNRCWQFNMYEQDYMYISCQGWAEREKVFLTTNPEGKQANTE